MHVRIWGTRGSIATPISSPQLRDKSRALLAEAHAAGINLADPAAVEAFLDRSPQAWTYGGNTSCVEISFGDQVFIMDAGTGLRSLGATLMSDGRGKTHGLHMFFTHFHWDHICGFPFFGPIYVPDREINVWSGRSDSERLLTIQMADAHFPVKWNMLKSRITCTQLPENAATAIAGASVKILPMIHPDKAYGYRVDAEGHSCCYLTDTEVSKNPNKVADIYAQFVEGADLVIVDAMYGFLEYHEHINFGHSTIFNWVDFFADSNIGELVIFHHDPLATDDAVTKLLNSAQRYKELVAPNAKWRLSAAREGLTWQLPGR